MQASGLINGTAVGLNMMCCGWQTGCETVCFTCTVTLSSQPSPEFTGVCAKRRKSPVSCCYLAENAVLMSMDQRSVCADCWEAMGTTTGTKRTTVYNQDMQNSTSVTTHPTLKTAAATLYTSWVLIGNQIQGFEGTLTINLTVAMRHFLNAMALHSKQWDT